MQISSRHKYRLLAEFLGESLFNLPRTFLSDYLDIMILVEETKSFQVYLVVVLEDNQVVALDLVKYSLSIDETS